MSKGESKTAGLRSVLSSEEREEWNEIIRAGVIAQQLIEGSIMVGGTASALYAGHRISRDTDYLLSSLKENFDSVLEKLSEFPDWKLARTKTLEPEWQDWNRIEEICHHFGSILGQNLITDYEPSTSENN